MVVCGRKHSSALLLKEKWRIWVLVVSLMQAHCHHRIAELTVALPRSVVWQKSVHGSSQRQERLTGVAFQQFDQTQTFVYEAYV